MNDPTQALRRRLRAGDPGVIFPPFRVPLILRSAAPETRFVCADTINSSNFAELPLTHNLCGFSIFRSMINARKDESATKFNPEPRHGFVSFCYGSSVWIRSGASPAAEEGRGNRVRASTTRRPRSV